MCIIYQKSADYLIGNTNDNYYDVQIMRLLEQNDMKTNKAVYEIVERIMKIRLAYWKFLYTISIKKIHNGIIVLV